MLCLDELALQGVALLRHARECLAKIVHRRLKRLRAFCGYASLNFLILRARFARGGRLLSLRGWYGPWKI